MTFDVVLGCGLTRVSCLFGCTRCNLDVNLLLYLFVLCSIVDTKNELAYTFYFDFIYYFLCKTAQLFWGMIPRPNPYISRKVQTKLVHN